MEIFDRILELYSEIDTIYKKIIVLDFEGKIGNSTGISLIELLKRKISLERELFDEFYDNYRDDYQWILNLLEQKMLELEDYITSRFYDYMSIHVLDKSIYEGDTLGEQKERESMNRLDRWYRECSKNLYLVYLSFMGDYVNSLAFSSVKKSLLAFKYFSSLTNHDMEMVLVYNNFNVGKDNYIDFNFMASFLKIDTNLNEEIRYMVYLDAVRSASIDLLSFNDDEYNDDYRKTNCISSGCMLRASLLLLSADVEGYEMAINDVNKLIQEMGNFYNGLSVDIIKSIIACVRNDKKRIKKISVMPLG